MTGPRRISALAIALLCGCAPASSLEGSLSESVSLAFDTVRIERSGNAIAVSYLRHIPGTTGDDVVLRILASTDGADLSKGGALDLSQSMAAGGTRGALSRLVHDDARQSFATLARGRLEFDNNPKAGARVTGSLSILFESDGGLGSGRTAFGTFSSVVRAAEVTY